MKYASLIKKYQTPQEIPYGDLLSTIEWKEKRSEVLKRDGYRCTSCGNTSSLKHNGKNYWVKSSMEDISRIKGVKQIVKMRELIPAEKEYTLHVHHLYYVLNELPWEIDESGLITLCNWCHWDVHESEKIKIYERTSSGLAELNFTPCFRCNGAGYLPEYNHVQNGICFRCNGKRFEDLIKK